MTSDLKKIAKQSRIIRAIYFSVMGSLHRFRGTLKLISIRQQKGPLNLNLGCGATQIPNFVGCDIYTGDVYLNLKRRFPFSDNSIQRIYMHHVLEHFELYEAEKILSEIYRVMKVGGRARFVVPDIEIFLDRKNFEINRSKDLNYYAGNLKRKNKYIETYMLALNEMFQMAGEHKFMYNRQFLSEFLVTHGFKNVTITDHGKSSDSVFDGIDPHIGSSLSDTSLCVEVER